MFRETHYDDNPPQKPYKKPKKDPADTQTDLFADFEQADKEDQKRKQKEQEDLIMESKYAEFVGPEKYAQLTPEEKAKVPEAYLEAKHEAFAKKFNHRVETFQQTVNRRALEIQAKEKISYIKAWTLANQEQENLLKESKLKREREMYQYLLNLQAKPEEKNLSNLPPEEPKDVIDEDGYIKDDKPGDDLYNRFKKFR